MFLPANILNFYKQFYFEAEKMKPRSRRALLLYRSYLRKFALLALFACF